MAKFKVFYSPKMSMRHPRDEALPTRVVKAKDIGNAIDKAPSIPGYVPHNAASMEEN